MKRYIALLTFTEKGLQHIKDSPNRADNFRAAAEKAGAKINALYWTFGPFDGLISFDVPDDATAEALMLRLGAGGYVRTQTMHALDRDSFSAVLAKGGTIR